MTDVERIFNSIQSIEDKIASLQILTTETQESSKSAHSRISEMAQHTNAIIRMGVVLENLTTVVANLVARVEKVEQKPLKWLDKIVVVIITLVLTYVFSHFTGGAL